MMQNGVKRFVVVAGVVAAGLAALPSQELFSGAAVEARVQPKRGVLLLAHGGSQRWNDNVKELAAKVDKQEPTEVAFGMATRANIQTAVDALVARGVSEIVAVP